MVQRIFLAVGVAVLVGRMLVGAWFVDDWRLGGRIASFAQAFIPGVQ